MGSSREAEVLEKDVGGDRAGVGRLRLGPVGALKPAGPFGGDLGGAF